ncbi:hypothetical protein QBC43DRAFT_369014 [Cladorrhinum sp. PSN259]|nr:hypothetical protein QBC43DRAFT_369014 [Cladorrhinum sp. PSN259]
MSDTSDRERLFIPLPYNNYSNADEISESSISSFGNYFISPNPSRPYRPHLDGRRLLPLPTSILPLDVDDESNSIEGPPSGSPNPATSPQDKDGDTEMKLVLWEPPSFDLILSGLPPTDPVPMDEESQVVLHNPPEWVISYHNQLRDAYNAVVTLAQQEDKRWPNAKKALEGVDQPDIDQFKRDRKSCWRCGRDNHHTLACFARKNIDGKDLPTAPEKMSSNSLKRKNNDETPALSPAKRVRIHEAAIAATSTGLIDKMDSDEDF